MKWPYVLAILADAVFLCEANGQDSTRAYYDAIALDGALQSQNYPVARSILQKYLNKGESLREFEKNPFLKDDVAPIGDLKESRTASGQPPAVVPGAVSWEGAVIAGTTEFLAARAREDINQYFLDRMRETLKKSPHFQYLFPGTYALMNVDGAEWAYGTMFEVLKASIQSDLSHMPTNLHAFIQNVSPYRETLHTSVLLQVLSDLLTILSRLQSGEHPADLFGKLDGLMVMKYGRDTTLTGLLRMLSKSSNALREQLKSPHAWVSKARIDSMTFKQRELLFGLIFQQVKDETLWNEKGKSYSLGEIVAESSDRIEDIKLQFRQFQVQIADAVQLIEDAKKKADQAKSGGETSAGTYTSYLDAIYQVLGKTFDQGIIGLLPPGARWQKNITRYKMILYHTRQLIQVYQLRQYGACISHALVILQQCDSSLSSRAPSLFRYASFLASVAGAQTADQVKDAIEAAALPAGSFSLKRKADRDLSINAYVGFWGGWAVPPQRTESGSGTLGMAAPIGITCTWGNLNCWIQALSVHLNVLDFGVPLNTFFKDSSGLPGDLHFKNFLSLGGGLLFHVRNAPFTWGIFGTYTPEIRNIADLPNKLSTWRFLFMIALDIPIFDLNAQAE